MAYVIIAKICFLFARKCILLIYDTTYWSCIRLQWLKWSRFIGNGVIFKSSIWLPTSAALFLCDYHAWFQTYCTVLYYVEWPWKQRPVWQSTVSTEASSRRPNVQVPGVCVFIGGVQQLSRTVCVCLFGEPVQFIYSTQPGGQFHYCQASMPYAWRHRVAHSLFALLVRS